MPIPWWKTAPSPDSAAKPEPAPPASQEPAPTTQRSGPSRPWSEDTPGAQMIPSAPTGFESTKLRCSAQGCTFQSEAFATAALVPGQRPYCQHHATGGELKVADLMWRLPCACGRVADGFSQVIGGYSAKHTATKCLERTQAAAPDDLTVPAGTGLPARPTEGTQVFSDRRCACGKCFEGVTNAVKGFVESHSVRECIEMTRRST